MQLLYLHNNFHTCGIHLRNMIKCASFFTQQICKSKFTLSQILAYCFIFSFLAQVVHSIYSKANYHLLKNKTVYQYFSAFKLKTALKQNRMLTLKILCRSLLVSQSEIFHWINEIHLIYHSTNLSLHFTDSGIDLFSNSTKVCLDTNV